MLFTLNTILMIFGVLILVAIVVMYKDIMNLFFPDNYAWIEIITYNLNSVQWLENINKKLEFKYKDKSYKLYYENNPDLRTSLRKGKNAHFKYFEGNEHPIKIDVTGIKTNESDFHEVVKKRIDDLFIESGLQAWLEKNAMILILAIFLLVIVLVIIFKSNPVNPNV